jgi:hypothetical protein
MRASERHVNERWGWKPTSLLESFLLISFYVPRFPFQVRENTQEDHHNNRQSWVYHFSWKCYWFERRKRWRQELK